MNGHSLTSFEASAINSILEEEERRFTGSNPINPKLSALDEQCKRIWPTWESTAAIRNSPSYQSRSEPRSPIMRQPERTYYQPREQPAPPVYESPVRTDFTSFGRDSLPVRRSPVSQFDDPIRTPTRADLLANDVDSLKSEVDSLMAKIRTSSRSPTANLEPSRRFESPTPRRPVYEDRVMETPPRYEERMMNVSSPLENMNVRARESVYSPSAHYEPPTRERYEPEEQREEPMRVTPTSTNGFAMPEALRLQQENVRLKAELLKAQKRLEAQKEENKKLLMSLDKSEQLRAVYKKRLEEYEKTTSPM